MATKQEIQQEAQKETEVKQAKAIVEPVMRTVNCIDVAPLLNVRESPNGSARIIGTVAHGESIDVEPARNGWLKVKSGGYVKEDFVD